MTFVRIWEISGSTLPETNIGPETLGLEGRSYVSLGESNWSPSSFESDTLRNFVLQAKDMTYLSMGKHMLGVVPFLVIFTNRMFTC